jgi:NTE family protein
VVRACEDLGIRPEIVVGASAGALVGVAYAEGFGCDELRGSRRHSRGLDLRVRHFCGWPGWRELADPSRLTSGIFSLHRLERHLRRRLPINDFRRLPCAVFVSAVDVDRGERVIFGPGFHDEVPISEAVTASCCVPGLFRPFRIGDAYYLDGELVRTLSADVAANAGADVIIVSNVYRPRSPERSAPIALQGPGLVLTQSLSIIFTEKEHTGLALHQRNYPHATFVDIAPDLGPYGYLNRLSSCSLLMRGYRTAIQRLSAAAARGVFGEAVAERVPRLLVPT